MATPLQNNPLSNQLSNQLPTLLQKPLLLGGLGLTSSLMFLDVLHGASHQALDSFGTTGLLALGAGVWWLRQRSTSQTGELRLTSRLTRAMVETELAKAERILKQLQIEVEPSQLSQLAPLQTRLQTYTESLDRPQTFKLAVVGGPGTGKTSLIQALAQTWKPSGIETLQLSDTQQIFAQSSNGNAWAVPQSVIEADMLLFLISGDLTDSEWQCLQWLQPRTARLTLVLNKQDTLSPTDQETLLSQIRQRVQSLLPPTHVVAIAAQPTATTVLPLQGDSHQEPNPPQLTLLLDRLQQTLSQESLSQVHWQTCISNSRTLQRDTKQVLNQLRQTQAIAIVERYQWISGGAAFINPVPSLDLLASLAVNGQLILDIAQVYQQPFSLEQGKTSAIALGEMTIKLGLVELSTQALGTILKTHTLTFLAGGVLQGASAAYLTRIVGLSLVEYFQEQDLVEPSPAQPLSLERLQSTIQRVFQAQSQASAIRGFLGQAQQRLGLPATSITPNQAPA